MSSNKITPAGRGEGLTTTVDLQAVAHVCIENGKTAVNARLPMNLPHHAALYLGTQVTEFERLAYAKGYSVATQEADAHLAEECGALQRKIDAVYKERNELAIALARLVLRRQADLGHPYGPDQHPWAGYGFDDKTGRAVVYVVLPDGEQVSWHMDNDISAGLSMDRALKPLPEFKGIWDGTFLARELDWASKYISIVPPDTDAGSLGDCVSKHEGNTAPAFRVDRAPEGATHCRICSGGKRRYYHLDPVTGWHYFHSDIERWYPTDLSADYLEAHLYPIVPKKTGTGTVTVDPTKGLILISGESDQVVLRAGVVEEFTIDPNVITVKTPSPTTIDPKTMDAAKILDCLTSTVSNTELGRRLVEGLPKPKVVVRYELLKDLALVQKAVRAEHGAAHAQYWLVLGGGSESRIAYRIDEEGETRFFSIRTGEWERAAIRQEWLDKNAYHVIDNAFARTDWVSSAE